MSENRRIVVPFERPAAYWASRARRHDTPSRRRDAARLMRKALEKSDDPRLAMELYHIYADLECHTAAERCLAAAISKGGLTGEICFGIGCCALNRGDEHLAERALELGLHRSPGSYYAARIQHLLESHPWRQEDWPPRSARGQVLLRRAQRALSQGDRNQSLSLAKQAWKKCRSYETALLLGALLPHGRAILPLTLACRLNHDLPECHLMLALALQHQKKYSAARMHMMIGLMLSHSLHQVEKFCSAAWETGMQEEALAVVEMHLSQAPGSADYLRLKYLCLRHLKREDEAQRALSALMEADPDDSSALWYRRHPDEIGLYAGRMMPYHLLNAVIWATPGRLRPSPLNRMLHKLTMILQDTLQAPLIYQLLPPLWRRLSPVQKSAADGHENLHYTLVFCLYLLMRTGYPGKAAEVLAQSPGKRRALRTLHHLLQWMNKE